MAMAARRTFELLAAALVLAAGPLPAAQLDFTADAVVGKANFTAGSGGATSATNLVRPTNAAEDPVSGELWVVSDTQNRVLRFASAAAFANGEAANLVLGQAGFTGDLCNRGGSASANTLCNPFGVAVDQGGRVYVSDLSNHRVLVFRPPFANGMNAYAVVGQADFASTAANRGGARAANTLLAPAGLAMGGHEYLYVADLGNNRVLGFQVPLALDASAFRIYGQVDFTTGAAGTTATSLNGPVGVFVDRSEKLWVADQNNRRVLRFDAGLFVADSSANLVLCQPDFVSAGSATTAFGCDLVTGVTVDPEGQAYVNDYGNHRILRYASPANGTFASAVIGQANASSGTCNRGATATADSLCGPLHAFLDRTGNLLVTDSQNDRVLRFDLVRARVAPTLAALSPESAPVAGRAFTLTVNGTNFYAGSVVNWNGSPRATAHLSHKRLVAQVPAADIASGGPFAVTVTTPGPGGGTSAPVNFTLYAAAPLDAVADRVLGQPGFTTGERSTLVGEEQVGSLNAATISPSGTLTIVVDPATGRLFMADIAGSRVMSWPSLAAHHNGQPADFVIGQQDEFSSVCGGTFGPPPPSASTLCFPQGLAVDHLGALYVSERNQHRVLQYVPPLVTGMAATRVFGQGGDFTTVIQNKGGVSADSLLFPYGLAFHDGKLFIHDQGNYRILVYDNPYADTTADVVIGQPDMTTNSFPSLGPTFVSPGDSAMAFDAQGRLHQAARSFNRVLRFTPPFTNGMAADLVIGQPDFATVTPGLTASRLSGPSGLAIDPAGNLLVADSDNNRVLRFAAPLESAMAATAVLGQANFTSNAFVAASASTFFSPISLAMDGVGNLAVLDYGNGRVLGFDRPFAFVLDPATDLDRDGIPNGVEVTESRDPYAKDNDVFAAAAPGPRLFAMQQYRDFLGREGDAGGIDYYTNILTADPALRAAVIENFFNSPEFGGIVAPVTRLYFAFFNRIPDYPGLQFQVNAYRTGTPLTVIANNFSLSPEFVATYGALSNSQYVTLLYQNVLGRTPVQAEVDFHVARLTSGVTRGEVMVGFSESPEYQALKFNAVYVTNMYVGMLRRSPEQAGFDFWVAYMAGGSSGQALIMGFLNAPEYRNRFLP